MKLNSQKIKSLFLLSLVGSSLAKEEKASNQTEVTSGGINLNLLPQMGTNLTAGENNSDPTLIFAGMPIFFREAGIGDQGRCVMSFAIVPTQENNPDDCLWSDRDGFLTSTLCCKGGVETCVESSTFLVADNPLWIGTVWDASISFSYDRPFIDYGFSDINSGLQLNPYVVGLTNNDKTVSELYPVTGLGSVTIGSEVCAYGPIGGYRCGEVVDIYLSRWTDSGVGPLFFKNLNKVDLGDYGFEADNDLGGPVYTVSNIGDRTIAQALGYITEIDNSDQHHNFIYYTPIDKALEEIVYREKCHYTLMTYNETSAEEFQAQIEVPAKT